jgi:hypothetical protein
MRCSCTHRELPFMLTHAALGRAQTGGAPTAGCDPQSTAIRAIRAAI